MSVPDLGSRMRCRSTAHCRSAEQACPILVPHTEPYTGVATSAHPEKVASAWGHGLVLLAPYARSVPQHTLVSVPGGA
eukprot:2038483-Rhodomonas_salina.8